MGSQFSKTMQLLRITADEIAYPQKQPANTSKKQNQRPQQPKYNLFNYRNMTDNQGWLPVKMDFGSFGPKSQNKNVDQDTLDRHLKALEKKQLLLTRFKHHEDFDRIENNIISEASTYEQTTQRTFFGHFLVTLVYARIISVQTYYHQYAKSLWFAYFKKIYLYSFPIPILISLLPQSANPINHEYFRSNPREMRTYENLAYEIDHYKYVDDIKYNFKYPEAQDYKRTVKQVKQKLNDVKYFDALKYYKRVYGIVDTDPYKQNKQDWQQIWLKRQQNFQKQNIQRQTYINKSSK